MKRGYNELVGLQATFSRVVSNYRLTHLYRWRKNGVISEAGSMRGYEMKRHCTIAKLANSLMDAYAPATLSIWKQTTKYNIEMYLQFEVGNTPDKLGLLGEWIHWAQL